MSKKQKVDVEVTGGGTVYVFTPKTDVAKEWIEANVSTEGFHPNWPTLVVEHRYAGDLAAGMAADGLVVA